MPQDRAAGTSRWRSVLLTVGAVGALIVSLDTALDAQAFTRGATVRSEVATSRGASPTDPTTLAVAASETRPTTTDAPVETCSATSGAE